MFYMKILLTKGKFAIVDKKDFFELSKYKWLATHRYAARAIYVTGNGKQTWIYMHKLILNAPKGIEVDHINHNTFDNRRKNLRIATHQQNSFNHPGYGHRGITKVTDRPLKKPYCVRLMINGKNLYLGYHRTMKEAKNAWLKGAKEHYGNFAP